VSAQQEETPRPIVHRGCFACRVTMQDVYEGRVIVSPQHVAHFGAGYGMTSCGKDATGNGWWWPL
jgi:hypothetical protein